MPWRSTRIRNTNPKYTDTCYANTISLSESYVYEVQENPISYQQPQGIIEWENIMEEEITALKKNETWDRVPLPGCVELISCKWAYKIK